MIEIPDPDSIPGVADWVELSVSITGNGVSKATVASAIEGASGEEPSEALLTSIWRALDYRHNFIRAISSKLKSAQLSLNSNLNHHLST